MDISAAAIYYAGAAPTRVMRLLQGIASGVLGNRSFNGGLETASLGLTLHYFIALVWTLIFFLVVRFSRRLLPNLFLTGMVYGVVVWTVMNLLVLPLSRVESGPISLRGAVVGAVILMFCIGLPIAMIVGRAVEDSQLRQSV
jgi:hypothetical protein